MSKRQSELHGNMQSKAEMTLPPPKTYAKSKYDHLFERYSVKEIHKLHFEQDMTPPQLEKHTGIPRRALVQRYFYDLGIKPNTKEKGKHPRADDKEWLEEKLKSGMTLAEIAREVDRTQTIVYYWCVKHGLDAKGYKINKSLRGIRPDKVGPNNPRWKGGKVIGKNGYVLVHKPDHPNAKPSDGYIMEHRLVMSEFLGRPLFEWEIVHHKKGNKSDNRIQNLELRYRHNHPPMKDSCCPNCGYELRWE